jgi:hypothetical protein
MRISLDEPEIQPVEKTEDSVEREAVKKTFKGEKKKLSQMTFPEKIKYIWSYYKAPIIIICVAALLVGYMSYVVCTRKTTMLMGVVVNDSMVQTKDVSETLADVLGLTARQQVELVDGIQLNSITTGTNYSHNMTGSAQILAYVAARELDFALCDADGLSFMENNELCMDVSAYVPEDYADAFAGRLVIQEGAQTPVAIDLTGTAFAEELGLHQEETYLVVTALSGHDEQLAGFMQYLAETIQEDGEE